MTIGLVVEGGASKTSYTAGVLDTISKNNININECIASTEGALFCCNYISKINNQNIPFFITGDTDYLKINNLNKEINYIKATCSKPRISKLTKINNHKYIDGNIKSKIPIRRALELEYDKIIVILNENYNYQMKKQSQLLNKIKYRYYPNLITSLEKQHIFYNETKELVRQLESDGKIFVIKPSKDIKLNKIIKNSKQTEELYNLGIKDTIDNLNSLKYYLNS